MKQALYTIILLFTLFLPIAATNSLKPKVHVIEMHSASSDDCKLMAPAIRNLERAFPNKPVIFTKLDFSNKNSSYKARLLASALGLDSVIKQYPETGVALVLNEKNEVAAILSRKDSYEKMHAIIKRLLNNGAGPPPARKLIENLKPAVKLRPH